MPAGRKGGASASPSSAGAGHRELVTKGRITAEKVRLAPYVLIGATADVRAFGDHVEMPLTASGYGGALVFTPRLDYSTEHLSAGLQVSQLDLAKLAAADPSTRGKITGRGELKMQLAASLRGDLMKSLTGQGNFALRDGRLPGVHLGKSMQQLHEVEKILSLGASGGGGSGETTFSVVQGDLDIHGARLHTSKTHLETNMGSGDMNGSIGFDQSLDLTGTWNLPKGSRAGAATAGAVGATVLTGGLLAPALLAAGGAALRVPFSVKGTLHDPKLVPGGGFSGSKNSDAQQTAGQQPQQPPQQKKKIFGIFPKP
jgi:hypothetical protein